MLTALWCDSRLVVEVGGLRIFNQLAKNGIKVLFATREEQLTPQGLIRSLPTQDEKPDVLLVVFRVADKEMVNLPQLLKDEAITIPLLVLLESTDNAQNRIALREELFKAGVLCVDFEPKGSPSSEFLSLLRLICKLEQEDTGPSVVSFGGEFAINLRNRIVYRKVDNHPIRISEKEYLVLEKLAKKIGQAVSYDEVLKHVYGQTAAAQRLDNFLFRIRGKLSAASLENATKTCLLVQQKSYTLLGVAI